MKRNQEDVLDPEVLEQPRKRRLLSDDDARECFRSGLFDQDVLTTATSQYASSTPYKHGVIPDLLDPQLLRKVRTEITTNISFAPKETDIYKIHQSGDLANLDGLDDTSLTLLPSLIKLRDALYSASFREYLSNITGAGPLSGSKTDMAVNVYTPTCHLLCHDDVIGTRRVSYILYLTDPAYPWKPEWGGALRLYPTKVLKAADGSDILAPSTHWSHSIPPSFNQLSFFAVQPGKSFHDVEEVYVKPTTGPGKDEDDGGRIRMAISGWFHIPQAGEPGYQPGENELHAEKSSLAQLQGNSTDADLPRPRWIGHDDSISSNEDEIGISLTEADLDFLLKFMNPRYLTPATVEELAESFADDSSFRLGMFLSTEFAAVLRNDLTRMDRDQKSTSSWETARPPHKHRFQYLQAQPPSKPVPNQRVLRGPHQKLVQELFPSHAFKKWLSHATGLELNDCHVLARRFRRGLDYTLATAYDDKDPQLEVSLGMTPTDGWGGDEEEESTSDTADDPATEATDKEFNRQDADDDEANMDSIGPEEEKEDEDQDQDQDEDDESESDQDDSEEQEDEAIEREKKNTEKEEVAANGNGSIDNVGGYEVYMTGEDADEDEEGDNADAEDDEAEADQISKPGDSQQPKHNGTSSHTGAGDRRRQKADPAVYGQSTDEDSGILLSVPASWNTLTVVLRDQGTLRFVKYVSQAAQGDRWDVSGVWKVEGNVDSSDDEDEEEAEADD